MLSYQLSFNRVSLLLNRYLEGDLLVKQSAINDFNKLNLDNLSPQEIDAYNLFIECIERTGYQPIDQTRVQSGTSLYQRSYDWACRKVNSINSNFAFGAVAVGAYALSGVEGVYLVATIYFANKIYQRAQQEQPFQIISAAEFRRQVNQSRVDEFRRRQENQSRRSIRLVD